MIRRRWLISLFAIVIIVAMFPPLYVRYVAGRARPATAPPAIDPPAAVAPAAHLSGPVPTAAGQSRLRFHAVIDRKVFNMAVIFSVSSAVAKMPTPVPVLLYLGGAGDRGSDGDAVYRNGPPAEMQRGADLAESMPMLIVAPQGPLGRDWDDPLVVRAMLQLIQIISSDPHVDNERIYLNGYSLGGTGAWAIAAAGAKYFAAVAPIPGEYSPDATAAALRNVPTWIICGADDGPFIEGSSAMARAMQKAGADCTLTTLPGVAHWGWENIYPNLEFYQWFLAHTRGAPPAKKYSPEQLQAIAQFRRPDPAAQKLASDFATFAPYWHISNCNLTGSPGVRAESLGRKIVLAVRPLNADVGCLIETAWKIPPNAKANLVVSYGHDAVSPYRLTINLDHSQALSKIVGNGSTENPWSDISLDLPSSGSDVECELIITATTKTLPTAYFSKIAIETK